MGIALEAYRLDLLERVVTGTPQPQVPRLLKYALKVNQVTVINREFRQQVRRWGAARAGRDWVGHTAGSVVSAMAQRGVTVAAVWALGCRTARRCCGC